MSAGTITFGEVAENHAGMQKLGVVAGPGLTFRELVRAKAAFEAVGCPCEIVDLISRGGVEDTFDALEPEPAEVLIVRGGLAALLAAGGFPGTGPDDLQAEHEELDPDKQALMRGRVVNKLARWNLCFAGEGQEPDYADGKGRVVPFADVPLTDAIRAMLPRFFGVKARGLFAEGNYYYDAARCGIGFHGDTERRIVIAVRFGVPIPLHYQWFHRGKPAGRRIALRLGRATYTRCPGKQLASTGNAPQSRPSVMPLERPSTSRSHRGKGWACHPIWTSFLQEGQW